MYLLAVSMANWVIFISGSYLSTTDFWMFWVLLTAGLKLFGYYLWHYEYYLSSPWLLNTVRVMLTPECFWIRLTGIGLVLYVCYSNRVRFTTEYDLSTITITLGWFWVLLSSRLINFEYYLQQYDCFWVLLTSK